jgi:hypothetical protein
VGSGGKTPVLGFGVDPVFATPADKARLVADRLVHDHPQLLGRVPTALAAPPPSSAASRWRYGRKERAASSVPGHDVKLGPCRPPTGACRLSRYDKRSP